MSNPPTETAAFFNIPKLLSGPGAYGFDTCMMEGYDEQRVSKLLKLPNGAFPIMVIGAGERADDGVFFPQIRFDRKLFIHEV